VRDVASNRMALGWRQVAELGGVAGDAGALQRLSRQSGSARH
jgi:hypothetical protein